MNEAEKQDSRKTIVAFGAGLLIGALLVWAFTSATPNDADEDDQTANVANTSQNAGNDDMDDDDADTSTNTQGGTTTFTSTGDVSVSDQPAGDVVMLDDVSYPEGSGWIAVGDYQDGDSLRFLGAARFDTAMGLEPTEVELLRATEAGMTYRVALFEENGDGEFSRVGGDAEIDGTATTFEAE